jgi:hypothetical protein
MIERFLTRFPDDGMAPVARVALALEAMRDGDFKTSDEQLARTSKLPPGSPHDLWTVARARSLRLHGDAESGLALLRPIVGKCVDPFGRLIFEEELTLAALATGRSYEAISYMDAWLRATPDQDKEDTAARVQAVVEQMPTDVLVGSLTAMRAQRSRFGYGADIARILSDRLVRIATATGDASLARLLLDPDAGALPIPADASTALGELATSRRGLNSVAGRTVGLLLPTDSPGLRDEAADTLRGVMWALGLPRGVRRSAVAKFEPSATATNLSGPCDSPAPAPELEDPTPSEKIRLVTHDDAGSADRTEVSLDELAGEGAAVIIAGLDTETSARALDWGEAHSVPVIVLTDPGRAIPPGSFGFSLGEPRENVWKALGRQAPSLTKTQVATVVDASEVGAFVPGSSSRPDAGLTAPVSCDSSAARAGDPRFPLALWRARSIHAWVVSGSPACATDLAEELTHAGTSGLLALTLESAGIPSHGPELRVVTAQAGVVPMATAGDPRADEWRRFSATFGAVGWWTALGRDAATLARLAVRQLPTTEANEERTIVDRRTAARDRLATARAALWTTEATGWTEGRTMKRMVCAREAHR